MNSPHPKPPARMPLLDGLRGIAAVAVMLHHEPGLYFQHTAITRAYLAVDFFYMLSGLVLTLAFEPHFARDAQRLTAARFLLQRVARLWPIIALGVLLGGVWQYLWHGALGLPLMLGMGLLLIPRLVGVPGRIYWLDGPQWSVVYEILGNFVHALVLWRLSTRALIAFTTLCGAACIALAFHFGAIAMGDTIANWWAGPFRLFFSYGTGMVIGRTLSPANLLRHAWLAAALPLPMVLYCGGLLPIPEPWLDLITVFLLFPPLLWLAARVTLPGALAPAALWLGRLSYPLYAVHIPLLGIGAWLIHTTQGPTHLALRIACAIATIAIAAIIAASPLTRGIPMARTMAAKRKP